MRKLNAIKINFIKKRGYKEYRKLYYMCKFFDAKVEILLAKPIEDLDKLLRKNPN